MLTLIRLPFLPVRLAFGTTRLGLRVGFGIGRLLGYRRMFVFAAGVGVGLLVAPGPGRELRQRLRELLEGAPAASDAELADKVRFELSHSPRTWHLPAPEVDVVAGRATLRGEAPHELGREDLERAAAAVPGVAAVDNQLRVAVETGTNGQP